MARDWIGLVIDAVRNGSATLDILRRRPLVIESLVFDDGSAAPESLLRWLAFDASWLSRRSLAWPMLASGRLTTHAPRGLARGRWLWLTSDHTDALLVGVADTPPVVTSKPLKDLEGEVVSAENVVSLVAASFETWLAGKAGIIDRRDVLVADPDALDALRGVAALAPLTRSLPAKPRAIELARVAPRADRVPLEPDAPLPTDKARRAWLEEVVMCDDAPSVKPALASMKRGARLTSFVDELLQNAIAENRVAAALELVRAAPDAVNEEHASLAGALGRLDLLRVLLDGGIDASGAASDEPIVCAAARNGELACVELLVGRGASPRDALLGACDAYEGRGAAVGAWLLDHGADANTTDDDAPVLHLAARRGDVALVQALLAHGADPRARTESGESVIDYADPHLPRGVEPAWFAKLKLMLAGT